MQSVFAQVCAAGNKWNNQKGPRWCSPALTDTTSKRDALPPRCVTNFGGLKESRCAVRNRKPRDDATGSLSRLLNSIAGCTKNMASFGVGCPPRRLKLGPCKEAKAGGKKKKGA